MTKTAKYPRVDLGALVNSMRGAQEEMSGSIQALREEIGRLRQERSTLLALPVEAGVAEKRVAEWVEDRVNWSGRMMGHAPASGNWNKPPTPEDFTKSPKEWHPKESDLLITLAFYLKNELTAAITKGVKELYTNSLKSISEEERTDRLAEIDRNILDAEMSEESIIRAAEKAGFKIVRRKDADPRAVLATDVFLP